MRLYREATKHSALFSFVHGKVRRAPSTAVSHPRFIVHHRFSVPSLALHRSHSVLAFPVAAPSLPKTWNGVSIVSDVARKGAAGPSSDAPTSVAPGSPSEYTRQTSRYSLCASVERHLSTTFWRTDQGCFRGVCSINAQLFMSLSFSFLLIDRYRHTNSETERDSARSDSSR